MSYVLELNIEDTHLEAGHTELAQKLRQFADRIEGSEYYVMACCCEESDTPTLSGTIEYNIECVEQEKPEDV